MCVRGGRKGGNAGVLLDTELPYCPAKTQETDSSLSYTSTFTLKPTLTTFK